MTTRKCISRLLAGVLGVSLLLTGCAGTGGTKSGKADNKKAVSVKLDPDDPVDITFWHYYNGEQQQEMKKLVDEFNSTVGAEEGIFVNEVSQGTVDDLTESLEAAVEEKVGAEECPDMFSAYADMAYEWDKEDRLVDLTKYFTEDELSEYVDGYIQSGRFHDGGLKLFPVAKSTEVFILNKTDWDAFAKETGADVQELRTWEGIAATAKKYYEWSGGKAFFGRDAWANYIFVGCKQLGKELYTVNENGEAVFQSDPVIFRKLWDNFYVPYISGYYTQKGKFRSDDVKTGTIIGYVGSSSSVGYFPGEVSDEDGNTHAIAFDIFPTPNFEGADSLAISQGAGVAVFCSDEKKEYACARFLKWFTQEQQNLDFSRQSGYLPVKKEAQNPDNFTISDDSDITQKTLEVTLGMSEEYNYYETQTFDNAYKVRNVVEDSLKEEAQKYREKVVELEQSGKYTHEEAVAACNTDEIFNAWFEGLQKQLEE